MVKKLPRKRFRPRKIDRRSAHEKWLFKMAKRPLYDLLPRNSEIHNFTSLKLTERQASVLGMGLKFRPSLLPPSEAQSDLQMQDFCRRVRFHEKFAKCPPDKDINPRLYVPTGWNPPRENPDLEDKLFALCKELLKNIVAGKPHWRNNLTKNEREELSELKSKPNIKILPTDKNLGPVLQRFGHPRVLGIPIPKSLAFWASLSHITAAFWASPGTLPGCPNP